MGASSGGMGGRARRGRRQSRHGAISEINVTPLVDVMLVLLIVFMVAAPLMTVSVPVDLPKTSAKPTPSPAKPLFITVQSNKMIYIDEKLIPYDQITAQVGVSAKDGLQQQIQVRADSNLSYGTVMEILGILSKAGYAKVGLATLPADTAGN